LQPGSGAKNPQPGEDEPEVVVDCGKDSGGGVAGGHFEIAAGTEVALNLHVSNYELHGGTTSQLALNGDEHATLLPGEEDTGAFGASCPQHLLSTWVMRSVILLNAWHQGR
jgi:hypothetical protein